MSISSATGELDTSKEVRSVPALSEDVEACVRLIEPLDLLDPNVYATVVAQFSEHTIVKAATLLNNASGHL